MLFLISFYCDFFAIWPHLSLSERLKLLVSCSAILSSRQINAIFTVKDAVRPVCPHTRSQMRRRTPKECDIDVSRFGISCCFASRSAVWLFLSSVSPYLSIDREPIRASTAGTLVF